MAYIVNVTNTTATTGATSPAIVLGTHQTNDLLLVHLTNRNGATAITTASAGWAMIGTAAASQGLRSQWAYKVATSSAEAAPTFSGSNGAWLGTCTVIRDADAASPIRAWQRSDWGDSATIKTASSNTIAASSAGGTTVITAQPGDLLVYAWSSDNAGGVQMRCKANDLIADARLTVSTLGALHIVGHRTHVGAAGNPAAVTMYANVANEGGNGWVLAIANKGGGSVAPFVNAGIDEWHWHGDFGVQHNGGFGTAAAPDTIDDAAPSPPGTVTLNGVDLSSVVGTITASTSVGSTSLGFSTWGSITAITSTENTGTAVGKWCGALRPVTTKNMSGKLYYLHLSLQGSSGRIGNQGAAVMFADTSGNWVAYQLFTKAAREANPERVAVIALGAATALGTYGTMDWTQVAKVTYLQHRQIGDTTSTIMYIKNEFLLDVAIATGGGANCPVTPYRIAKALQSWGLYRVADVQGSSQALLKHSVKIGDGTEPTYYDSSAASFEFPTAYSVADGTTQQEWNVAAGTVSLKVLASASDTINMAAGVAATETAQALTIDSSSSASAAYSFSGQSFVGFDATWKTGVPCANATFKFGGIIDFKGADISNVIASNGTGTALLSASDGFSATDCTFTASTTAVYGIRIAAAGTFDLDGTTFSGFTKDIDVTAVAGTVTINLAAGQATPTYQTAGATVSIVSSPVFQSVTVSGAVAGSRIQIYDTTSSTELYNGTPSFPYTWTDGSPASASRAIRLRCAYQSTVTAKDFIDQNIGTCGTTAGTEDISVLVTQTADDVYNTNAIDGSTVTDITIEISGGDRVKIAKAGGAVTWASIYAYQVYWQATATGIAQETAFIEAPDTANYLLTDFDIKNTHGSIPLTITGGWGRDAVTGLSKDIIDTTGTNIYLAPDHVIPYSTGSGLTAGQAAQLTAIEGATGGSGEVRANIVKVNDLVVSGSGTEADPWGP